jgi:hypothetical protein
MTFYAKAALYDAFKAWCDGGPVCPERFDGAGAWRPTLTTQMPSLDLGGKKAGGVEKTFVPKVFEPHVWGLEWVDSTRSAMGFFPTFANRSSSTYNFCQINWIDRPHGST